MSTDQNIIATDQNAEVISRILPKLQQLDSMLESQAPGLKNYLLEINEDLRQYPDLVHLLTDEQIKPIYSSLRAITNTVITAKAAKANKEVKGTKKVSSEDGNMLANLL
jgi:hypothetical protein